MSDPLVILERDSRPGRILMVASLAPARERPHYCIFTRRQIESIRQLGIPCDVLAIFGYRSPLAYAVAAAKLARLGRSAEEPYALVHAHGGEAAVAATAYRRAPLLVSYLGSDLLGLPDRDGHVPLIWRLRSTVIRNHARLTNGTIVQSASMLSELPSHVRRRGRIIPNGVDREAFRPRDRSTTRAALGWDSNERVVLFAADPSRASKRFGLARAATEKAARRVGPVRLHIARNVAPEAMPDLMNASDCLIHPSASEGSSNVIKEALACNLPVVATPVGDAPQLLAGVLHCYVRRPDVDELAGALVQCLDPPVRSNGRTASAALDASLVALRVAAVYMDIAGDRVRTP